VAWEVVLHHEVEVWFLALGESDPETADLVEDAIDQLADEGPALGGRWLTRSRAAATTT
jgi:hypothetical protein